MISIIIPNYNKAKDLQRALKSVLAQTYSNWEALVIDNHSNDNTDDIVKSFNDPRIKLFKIHNDGVIAASRNLGIKHAQGEYVAFLDSDDWWKPQKLEISLKYFEHGFDVVYHDLFIVTKGNQHFYWKRARSRDLKYPVFDDLLRGGNTLNNSSVAVRKKFLAEINGLSEDRELIAAEDYDAWLRIAKLTNKFKRIDKTLGYYWAGGKNTSNPTQTLKNIAAIEERYHDAISNLGGNAHAYWFNYVKGRANYLLGSCEAAKQSLNQIHWRHAPLLTKIKSSWMLLQLKLL